MTNSEDFLDTFDHVVVLMMENRSFDNLLGFLYNGWAEDKSPDPESFEGAQGHSCPGIEPNSSIPTTADSTAHMPYPDPGEYFDNCMYQLYGTAYDGTNPNPPGKPTMTGFVTDYHQVLLQLENPESPVREAPVRDAPLKSTPTKQMSNNPWLGDPSLTCNDIMKCHSPESIPALAQIARDFAVFDHWFCALPSATWPNRAFWHADTSYGWADNPSNKPGRNILDWLVGSNQPTLFCQLQQQFAGAPDSCHIYADQLVPLTQFVHAGALGVDPTPELVRGLERERGGYPNFFSDCKNGDLPKYSFLEPHFLNYVDDGHWHNDMHPSKWLSSVLWAPWGETKPGSVPLGDQLILRVYEAIRTSPQRDRTLFIITFDENGGCYDHVPPPTTTAPDASTYYGVEQQPEYGFDFRRLGARVPTVMVSSRIEAQTVNAELNHASFLKTMHNKWGLPPLGPRETASAGFADKLVLTQKTPKSSGLRHWPPLSTLLQPQATLERFPPEDDAELSGLQQSVIDGLRTIAEQVHGLHPNTLPQVATLLDAQVFMRLLRPLFLKD